MLKGPAITSLLENCLGESYDFTLTQAKVRGKV